MSGTTVAALAAYAFVTSITPGPNNLMLLASGTNFGLRRTLPHLLGISLGFGVMVFGVGLGLTGLFLAFPPLYLAMKVVGAAYLVWLAWRIATAAAPTGESKRRRPMSFLGAAAFQWVNPKAWIMAVGAISNYAPAEAGASSLAVIALVYALVNAPSVAVWAAFGAALRNWLTHPRRLRIFNIAMAILLLASLYPILTAEIG